MLSSNRLLRFALAALCAPAALLGCATAQVPLPPPPVHAEDTAGLKAGGAPRAETTWPLLATVAGQWVPWPVLEVEIAGRPVKLIVDSGSSYHVLSAEFAQSLALETVEAPAGRDAADRILRPAIAPSVTVTARGKPLIDGHPMLVVRLPPELHAIGIEGMIAPHFLAGPGERAVLDLRAGQLRIEPDGAPTATSAATRVPIEVCTSTSGVPHRILRVDAVVAGKPAKLLVGTGSGKNTIYVQSTIGQALWAEEGLDQEAAGVRGRFVMTRVPAIRMMLGGAPLAADLHLTPGQPRGRCPRDGTLGMDLLRQCRMIFAAGADHLECEFTAPRAE